MTIREELEIIRNRNGGMLRPEDVVLAARSKHSPLHCKFNWDDDSAAHAWRLEQARHLIRVFVNVLDTGKNKIESRMFVALTNDKESGGGYRVLTDVLGNTRLREYLLADAYEDMRRFTQKYHDLKELSEVLSAMRKVRNPRVGRKGTAGNVPVR